MGFRQIFRFITNIEADFVADLEISTSRASAAPQAIHGLLLSVFGNSAGNSLGNAKAVLIKATWLLAATSTLTWAEAAPAAADGENPAKNTQWACRADSEGGWVCDEQDVSGPV